MESKKNAHRLNRIFRKPKTMASTRSWREADDENSHRYSGVSVAWLNAMVRELTEDDTARAVAGQDPPSVVQEELAKRAARFGLPVMGGSDGDAMQKRMERFGTAGEQPQQPLMEVDEAKLKMREARFKTEEWAAMNEATQRRQGLFGATPAVTALKLSDADREAMERRQNRFAT